MTIKHRGPKSLLPIGRWDGLGRNRYFSYRDMPYGGERRRAILRYLQAIRGQNDHDYILINRKYCLLLRLDKDLQRLLREGKVKMVKIRQSRKTTYSAIVLPDWEAYRAENN